MDSSNAFCTAGTSPPAKKPKKFHVAPVGKKLMTPGPKEVWKMDIGAMHGGISSRNPSERLKLIRYRDPKELLHLMHPLNEKIYGEAVLDASFLKSIKDDGVIEPVVICKPTVPHYGKRDGGHRGQLEYVLSGHRRIAAAIQVGLKKIPVRCMSEQETSEAEVIRYLILFNQQRRKSPLVRVREAAELAKVEKILAQERMKAGREYAERRAAAAKAVVIAGKAAAAAAAKVPAKGPEAGEDGAKSEPSVILHYPPEPIVTPAPAGKVSDIVGKAVGVSASTAAKLIQINAKMEESPELKAKIEEAFNNGDSVSHVYTKFVKRSFDPSVIAAADRAAAELTALLKGKGIDGMVTRSREPGRFHLTLRDVTAEQIRKTQPYGQAATGS